MKLYALRNRVTSAKPGFWLIRVGSEAANTYTQKNPKSDLVIDCAMNANAIVTTSNLRDFRNARESLGLQAIAPAELVTQLALEGS